MIRANVVCAALALSVTSVAHDASASPDAVGASGARIATAATAATVPTEAVDPHDLPPVDPSAVPDHPPVQRVNHHRDGSEIAILYITSIGWGASIAIFIDGMTQSDNVYGKATLLGGFGASITAGLGAVVPLVVDLAYHRRPGVPQTIATSMLLGLGEGVALNEYFSNRAETSFHTYTKDAAWVFGGATTGLVVGLVTAAFVKTTPGRAAWVATTGLFGGFFTASLAAVASRPAGYPNPSFDREGIRNVGLTAAIGGLAGIAGGITTAKWISPSSLRVHLIDAAWILGMTVPGIVCINHCDTPETFGLMGIGAGVGFGSALALTSLLPKEHGGASSAPGLVPYATPLPGGGIQVGLGGSL